MLLSVLVGRVNRDITVPAQNRSVLLTEQESSPLLANVAEREFFGRRVEKREALVFGGELVRLVDAVVAGVTKGSLVGGAEHRGLVIATYITLDLHRLLRSDRHSEYSVAKEKEKLKKSE